MKHTGEKLFRLSLIFQDGLATMQAVPLNGVPSPMGHPVGGIIRGKEELVSLISHTEIDSIVKTRQLGESASSENGPPTFERTFYRLPPSQIIGNIEMHFAACEDAEMKIISGDEGCSAARRALVDIVLGSTKLSQSEGDQRTTDWLKRRPSVIDRTAL
ncbi:MAG TPA: hypothetical protein VEV17_12805 [Bryobacteraceae bacterium]|nr:hypothetical protein [Bryobacteraceae bacterium]